MKALHMIAVGLVIAGALNWGLIALFDFNLVSVLLGSWPTFENAAYIVIGACAVYLLLTHMGYCKICGKK